MDKAKKILNAWWFKAAAMGLVGAILLISGMKLFGGIAIGMGIREILFAFKKETTDEDQLLHS